MKNQFFYKRKEQITPIEGETEAKYREYTDSFNVDLVIRTISLEDGRRLVLLNDIHERMQQVPQYNTKGQVVGKTKERNTFQSEIYLEKMDSDRFISQLTEPSMAKYAEEGKVDYELGS